MAKAPRFQCIMVSPGRWTVWDTVADQPASLGGWLLTSKTGARAEAACDVLNRIYENRLQRDGLPPPSNGD